MKPLCDHRAYCLNDKRSTFIGQDHHIAHTPHRNTDGYFPSAFCTFTAHHGGNDKALCTAGNSGHSWQTPG